MTGQLPSVPYLGRCTQTQGFMGLCNGSGITNECYMACLTESAVSLLGRLILTSDPEKGESSRRHLADFDHRAVRWGGAGLMLVCEEESVTHSFFFFWDTNLQSSSSRQRMSSVIRTSVKSPSVVNCQSNAGSQFPVL